MQFIQVLYEMMLSLHGQFAKNLQAFVSVHLNVHLVLLLFL